MSPLSCASWQTLFPRPWAAIAWVAFGLFPLFCLQAFASPRQFNANYANWIQRCGRVWTVGLLASGFEGLTGTARKEHCGLLFLVAAVELVIILGIVFDNAQTASAQGQGVASKEKEKEKEKQKEKEKPKSQ